MTSVSTTRGEASGWGCARDIVGNTGKRPDVRGGGVHHRVREVYVSARVKAVGLEIRNRVAVEVGGACRIGEARGGGGGGVPHVALYVCYGRPLPLGQERRDSDGGEDADYDHDRIVAKLQTRVNSDFVLYSPRAVSTA